MTKRINKIKISQIIRGINLIVFFTVCCLFGRSAEPAPEIISFTIPVGVEKAVVYSGPGENYYPTGTLTAGEVVEAFLRNPDGWCAIRPPEKSFSWINARFVKMNGQPGNNIGVIHNEDSNKEVPVRVGADSVMKSSAIQVGLTHGKKVRVLGEMTLPGGSTWYKISPPAGEFRWIHEKMLFKDSTITRLPSQLTLAKKNMVMMEEEANAAQTITPQAARSPQASEPSGATDGSGSLETTSPSTAALPYNPTSGNNPASKSNQTRTKTIPRSPIASTAPTLTPNLETSAPTTGGYINRQEGENQGLSPQKEHNLIIADKVKEMIGRPAPPSSKGNPLSHQSDYKVPLTEPAALEEGYYLEVSRVNRDFFAAMNRGASDDIYATLSDRCSVLFQAAQNDDQRTAIKKVYDNINKFRQGNFPISMSQNPKNQLQFSLNNSSNRNSNTKQQNNRSSANDNSNVNNLNNVNNGNDSNSRGLRLRYLQFAFSGNNAPFRKNTMAPVSKSNITPARPGSTRSYGRNSFPVTSGPTLVPPPSYNTPNLNSNSSKNSTNIEINQNISNGNNETQKRSSLKNNEPPVPELDSFRYTQAGKSKEETRKEIRQVTALIPHHDNDKLQYNNNEDNNEDNNETDVLEESEITEETKTNSKPKDIATWKSPTPKPDSRRLKPVSVHSTSKDSKMSFDAIGKLGYFPNRPEGYPAYALVREENGQEAIFCFVEAESGENLDRFVGKTIGIKGKTGWFRRENESRKMITAKSIFSLKNK